MEQQERDGVTTRLPGPADVSLTIYQHEITAFIGSSGSGKSTVLRAFNQMNDLVPTARMEGDIDYRGASLYGPDVSPVAARRRIGMVFQKPNPFPKSIYENVAYGPRINGIRKKSQLDETASALDPIATGRIEDLMHELESQYTIVIVTHNMQQVTRVSDRTAFFSVLADSETDTAPGCSSSTARPSRSSRTRTTAARRRT